MYKGIKCQHFTTIAQKGFKNIKFQSPKPNYLKHDDHKMIKPM